MKQIAYNINDFHPSMRASAQKEIELLQKETPPFGRGNCKVVLTDTGDQIYAKTKHDVRTGDNAIHMNVDYFGPNADLKKLNRYLEEDHDGKYHGDMIDPMSNLTHEYGHVLDGMLHHTFLMEDNDDGSVLKAYRALYKLSNDKIMDDRQAEFQHFIGRAPKRGNFVSVYAHENRNEFFAENFAARHWDLKQKDNPMVLAMNDLIAATYVLVKKLDTKLDDYVPWSIRAEKGEIPASAASSAQAKKTRKFMQEDDQVG